MFADILRNEELLLGLLLAALGDIPVLDQRIEIHAFGIGDVEISQQDVGHIIRLLPPEQEIRHRLDLLEPPLINPVDEILSIKDMDRTKLEIKPPGTERHHERGPGELDAVQEFLLGKHDLTGQAGELDFVGVIDESHGLVAAGRPVDPVRHDIGPVVAQDTQYAFQADQFLGVHFLNHDKIEMVDDFRQVIPTLLVPVVPELTDIPCRKQQRLRRRLLRDLGAQLFPQRQKPFDHADFHRIVLDLPDFLVTGHIERLFGFR